MLNFPKEFLYTNIMIDSDVLQENDITSVKAQIHVANERCFMLQLSLLSVQKAGKIREP